MNLLLKKILFTLCTCTSPSVTPASTTTTLLQVSGKYNNYRRIVWRIISTALHHGWFLKLTIIMKWNETRPKDTRWYIPLIASSPHSIMGMFGCRNSSRPDPLNTYNLKKNMFAYLYPLFQYDSANANIRLQPNPGVKLHSVVWLGEYSFYVQIHLLVS